MKSYNMALSIASIIETSKLVSGSWKQRIDTNTDNNAAALVASFESAVGRSRGWWIIPHGVAFCIITATIGFALVTLSSKFPNQMPKGFLFPPISLFFGVNVAYFWFSSVATKKRPFTSVLCILGVCALILFLIVKF